ncbi:MAG: hypothetical protein L3K26_00270 [Candidatus Hydrogenedentes bacterium]|nr:hypothetical protein [Candidatus Hydrogenedentota bacterium]
MATALGVSARTVFRYLVNVGEKK